MAMTDETESSEAIRSDAHIRKRSLFLEKLDHWWRRLPGMSLREPRRLRLCESLSLGERRFVAVIEYEHKRFLVGGTSASLALLTPLDREDQSTFADCASRPTWDSTVETHR